MAKMITRTFTYTKGAALTMDCVNKKPDVLVYTVPGKLEDEELFKAVAAKYDKLHEIKVCMISTHEVVEELRGMTEDVFLANSVVLPPRKVYEKADETDDK